MITLFCSLTVLISITSFSIAVNVTQTPSIFLLSRTGEPAVLHCVHDAADHYYLYWYRQVRDGGLTLIAYSLNKDDAQYEAGFESSFTIHRPEVKRSSFEIKSVKSEDTAVYFCAPDRDNYPAYFGEGTKLTVLEHNISEPILHILEPSKEEIVQKKRVTLVCLATNFYPDHIEITWKINGKNRTGEDGVKTDDYAIKDNNTNNYTISSRLRLTPKEWFNPENTFTCAVKFYKGNGSEIVTPEKHISGKDGCGMTKALNQNESVAARISYMLLVGKSLMYGLFVTFLVWKLRPNSSSKRLN